MSYSSIAKMLTAFFVTTFLVAISTVPITVTAQVIDIKRPEPKQETPEQKAEEQPLQEVQLSERLSNALNLNPFLARLNLQAGNAFLNGGQDAKALFYFQRAFLFDPSLFKKKNEDLGIARPMPLPDSSADYLSRAKELKVAGNLNYRREAINAILKEPSSVEAVSYLARALYFEGRLGAAVELFKIVTFYESGNIEANDFIGKILVRSSGSSSLEAMSFWERGAENLRNDPDAIRFRSFCLKELGMIKSHLGDFKGAREDLTKAMQLDPTKKDLSIEMELSIIAYVETIEENLARELSLRTPPTTGRTATTGRTEQPSPIPDVRDAVANLGPAKIKTNYWYEKGLRSSDGKAKLDALQKALKTYPDKAKVNLAIANALLDSGKYDKVIPYAQETLKDKRLRTDALYCLAMAHLAKGRGKKVVELCQVDMDTVLSDTRLSGLYGEALRVAGKDDEAVVFLRGILDREFDNYRALTSIARLYIKKGLTLEAEAALEQAIVYAPNEKTASTLKSLLESIK